MKTLRTLSVLAIAATSLAAIPTAFLSTASASGGSSYPAGDGPMGSGYYEEVNFPSSLDGTMLHADVLLPGAPEDAPEGGWPMIISGGPYFSASKYGDPVLAIGPNPLATGPVERFADFIVGADIFAEGYGWAQVDTRGYGSSGNCNDYGGIGEQTDMATAVDYFGTQAYSSGKVGLWGKSYDAWTQVMALAQHPEHLAAAVIQAPLIEGYRLAWDNGVHWDSGWYATTGLYALYDNEPVGSDADAQEHAQSAESTARAGECWPENLAMASAGYDRTLEYWEERNLIPSASTSQVPTFWTMGFQ
ncbi:MAG: putative CocE/NonD family hydrolase, partial [Glaciecola sp.]